MLTVNDLHASYGSGPVLMGVSLAVREGEVLALLGRNGAGKTTLMRALVGLLPPSAGEILFGGRNIAGEPAHRTARRGIAYVPQGRGIFAKLTVRENLLIGTRGRRDGRAAIPEQVFAYFPILKERIDQLGGTLSGGQQQMLALGRALCGDPRLLLLDEPSEGIQPSIVQQIGEIVSDIARSTGISVLLVEQNLDLGLSVSSQCLVMDKGRIVYEGVPADFEDETLLTKYLAI